MNEITNSLDWRHIEDKLRKNLSGLSPHNRFQVSKLISNISNEITELSKMEVIHRQKKGSTDVKRQIEKIQENIILIEEFIIIGKLLG